MRKREKEKETNRCIIFLLFLNFSFSLQINDQLYRTMITTHDILSMSK